MLLGKKSAQALWSYDFRTERYTLSPVLLASLPADISAKVRDGEILEMIAPDDRGLFKMAFQAMSAVTPHFNAKCKLAGQKHISEIKGTLIFDHKGRPVQIDGVVKPFLQMPTEIMIVDDSDINRQTLGFLLEPTNYEPFFVEDGAQALMLYSINPKRFSLILMDITMPIMDGYEATKAIRSFEVSKGLAHCPIIALTGHTSSESHQTCLRSGMSDILIKPVRQAQLCAKLDYYMSDVAAQAVI